MVSDQASTSSFTHYDPRLNALFLEESQVVGVDGKRDKLIEWIVKDTSSGLGVLSVFGTGGLGKTTLIKKVFHSPSVKYQFSSRAWITVSQTYDIKSLLTDLGMQLGASLPQGLEVTQLKLKINDYLRERSYAVVLDDIWKLESWHDIKHALPEGKLASNILVTTRFIDIAKSCTENSGYAYLEPLSSEDALKLFCKKAFRSDDGNCLPPTHLKEISQKFLDKCKGLPLAIVSIGGLLRTKSSSEWDQVDGIEHLTTLKEIRTAGVPLPQVWKAGHAPVIIYDCPRRFAHW